MKYYKILNDSTFLNVATSDNFIAKVQDSNWFLSSDEIHGELISIDGHLYHDYWMQPIYYNTRTYELVQVIEITKEQYDALVEAIQTNTEIIEPSVEDDEEEEIIQPVIPDTPDVTIEFVRSSKINEMSRACNQIIEAGFDIELYGETHHFSLTTQDQLNLISLQGMLGQGMLQVPYHADGEICRFYSVAEMDAIITAATGFKIYHTTYYNALKNYINSLDNIQDITAITYGIELPEEYQSDVLKTLL